MGSCNTMETSFTPAANDREGKKALDKESKAEKVLGETTSFVCSELMLISLCLVLLTIELVSDTTPLHYYEGFFTLLVLASIFFLFFVFCFLNKRIQTPHESKFDGLWLRVGGIVFGLGSLNYNRMEFGSWFEIPDDSVCFQYLRGLNPILQAIFTISQMVLLLINSKLNIPQFKGLASLSLMHIVATNICVWIRTVFKEGIKDIAAHRVARGEGHSEDFMIKAVPTMTTTTRNPPPFNPILNNPLYPGGAITYPPTAFNQGKSLKQVKLKIDYTLNGFVLDELLILPVETFFCGRIDRIGDVAIKSAPYLYPLFIQFSMIGAMVLFGMWTRLGKNQRF